MRYGGAHLGRECEVRKNWRFEEHLVYTSIQYILYFGEREVLY